MAETNMWDFLGPMMQQNYADLRSSPGTTGMMHNAFAGFGGGMQGAMGQMADLQSGNRSAAQAARSAELQRMNTLAGRGLGDFDPNNIHRGSGPPPQYRWGQHMTDSSGQLNPAYFDNDQMAMERLKQGMTTQRVQSILGMLLGINGEGQQGNTGILGATGFKSTNSPQMASLFPQNKS